MYSANYRFPIWLWLAAPFTVIAGFFFAYATITPSLQGNLADQLGSSGLGMVLLYVPIPLLFLLALAFAIAMLVFSVALMIASLSGKLELVIDQSGITHFPLFGRSPRRLRWEQITHVGKTDHMIFFKGHGDDGAKVQVNATFMGGKRRHILDMTAHFRPDLLQFVR